MFLSSAASSLRPQRIAVGLRQRSCHRLINAVAAANKNKTNGHHPATAAMKNPSLRHKSSSASSVSSSSSIGSGGIPAPILHQWYNIFGKSTIGYATWLIAGIIVAEGLTGMFTDAVWNSANKGRTFESVDWSKFKSADDEEEEEEEEEAEEEEEETEEEEAEDDEE